MEDLSVKILSWLSSWGALIILSILYIIGTLRMIGDIFSLYFENKFLKVLFVSKEKEVLNEIKDKIDKIEFKDHNLKILNDNIDKTITKIYEELFVLLGITCDELKSLVKQYLFEKKTNENISKDPLKELILLLARCTYKFGREVTYGTETPINTKYYINTMSITHNANSGRMMCMLLSKLMEQKKFYPIDFIITPKSGNPILAHKFASMFRIPVVLLHKSESESSAVKLSEEEYERILQVNYEGFDQLKSLMGKDSSGKIRGVALDCNTSGGKQLLKAITSFNDLIDKVTFRQKIEKVTKAFVLFRAEAPPDSTDDIDQKFSSKGIEIIRYFDCNEGIKQKLAEFSICNGSVEEKVKDVIKMLKENDLLRFKMEGKDEY